MTEGWASAVAGLAGVAMSLILVPILLRWGFARRPVAGHVVAGAVALALAAGTGGVVVDRFDFWLAASIVGFAAMANLFAFGAVFRSVSLRMLACLERMPGGTAAIEHLEDEVSRPLIDGRIDNLQQSGLVEAVGSDRFQVTGRGRKLDARLKSVQRLFGIRRSGLYGDQSL